jgi:hypothetical protein
VVISELFLGEKVDSVLTVFCSLSFTNPDRLVSTTRDDQHPCIHPLPPAGYHPHLPISRTSY